MTEPIANARLRPMIWPILPPVIMNAAITSVYIVIAVWIPVTVVPTSCATVAIDTFITEVSSVIRNCADASVSKTLPDPFAALVVAPACSIRRMLPASAGGRVLELRGDDQPLVRRVLRVAGRQHQRWILCLREHLAGGVLGQHVRGGHQVVVSAVPRDEADRVARLDLIEVEERVQVGGAMPSDPDAARALPRIGGVDVVTGTLLQILVVGSLDDDHVEIDPRDQDDGVRIARKDPRRGSDRRHRLRVRLPLLHRRLEPVLRLLRLDPRSPQEPRHVPGEVRGAQQTEHAEPAQRGMPREALP